MICPSCNRDPQIGEWPFDCKGRGHQLGSFWTGESNIHPSERVVVLENPRTGQVRIPGRADRLSKMDKAYMAEGFVRKELETHAEIRQLEKTQGVRHERSHYDKNSARADRDVGSL